MTKTKLLFVSLFLVFGLAATVPIAMGGPAGTVWSISFNTNEIRNEGSSEAVGTLAFTFEDLNSDPVRYTANNSFLRIIYNASIEQDIDGDFAVDVACSGQDPQQGPLCGFLNPVVSTSAGSTHPNNELTIDFKALDWPTPPLTTNTQIYATVRVNAIPLAPCYVISASVSGSQVTNTPLTILSNESPYILGNVKCGPATTVTIQETADVLTCIGVKEVASYDNDFCVRVLENDVDALTSQSDESFLEADTDFPTNGSNILITLTGVPPLVGVSPRSPKVCEDFNTNDPNYCPDGLLVIQDAVSVPGQPPGQLQFFYQIDETNTSVIEAADFCFKFWSKGPLPPGQHYTITETVSLTSTNPPSGEDAPSFTGTEATGLVVVQFYDCDTDLLWPFVTNYMAGPPFLYNNFGSIILVANTTWDPLATADAIAINPQEQEGTAIPQSGPCEFWLFPSATGAFADGSAASYGPISYVSPTIYAGGVYGFDMGSIPQFAGRTGYIWAKCEFQNAHGLGFFQDGYGIANPGYAAVYDAIVIPTPEFYHRSPAGDGLGESAVAPLAVSKAIQKLLFYGVHNAASGHSH